jgi:hypothetical protein
MEATSACSRSAGKASCWRPRSICWQSKLLEATLHLLAKQAAGGHAPSAGKASCWRIFILHEMEVTKKNIDAKKTLFKIQNVCKSLFKENL